MMGVLLRGLLPFCVTNAVTVRLAAWPDLDVDSAYKVVATYASLAAGTGGLQPP